MSFLLFPSHWTDPEPLFRHSIISGWKLRKFICFGGSLSRAVRKISKSTTHLLGNILMFMRISDLCKLGFQEGPSPVVVDNVIALTAAGMERGAFPAFGKYSHSFKL